MDRRDGTICCPFFDILDIYFLTIIECIFTVYTSHEIITSHCGNNQIKEEENEGHSLS